MTDDYRKELVQVAAACLAAAQVAEVDTTSLGTDNEGVRGRFSLERLLDEVRNERRRQELRWGTRTGQSAPPHVWLAIVDEEIGEVAEELVKQGDVSQIVTATVELGKTARQMLESPEGPH